MKRWGVNVAKLTEESGYGNHRLPASNGMKRWFLVTAILAFAASFSSAALAARSSATYTIYEDFIGAGGLVEESDPSTPTYKLGESIGDTGIGDSSSTSYSTSGGYTTTPDPALTFTVNTSSINFGNLNSTMTATGTATFSVINYTTSGYIVTIDGATLTSGGNDINALATPTASAAGTEQFGINLKDNATPNIGAEASGGNGAAATNYNAADLYKYVAGDTLANATRNSGQTNFTLSYIVNINIVSTPTGAYSATHTLICTGTY